MQRSRKRWGGKPRPDAGPAAPKYDVSYRPVVAQDVARWGLDNADFTPTLDQLIKELETNPHQFPLKYDELAGARVAELVYRGQTWRAVFDIDEYASKLGSLR